MKLTSMEFRHLASCLAGFFFGTISILLEVFRPSLTLLCPGIHSGVFSLYLEHRGSQKGAAKAKNALFYSLCVLYALSVAIIIGDIVYA